MREPTDRGEWRRCAAAAKAALWLDSARQYGLIADGPNVNVTRCEEIIERAAEQGISPTDDEIDVELEQIIRGHAAESPATSPRRARASRRRAK